MIKGERLALCLLLTMMCWICGAEFVWQSIRSNQTVVSVRIINQNQTLLVAVEIRFIDVPVSRFQHKNHVSVVVKDSISNGGNDSLQ